MTISKPGRKYLARRKTAEGYAITMAGGKKPIVRIVPDKKYPEVMWRVVEEDGTLSDMVNLSRAVDAAMNRALVIIAR